MDRRDQPETWETQRLPNVPAYDRCATGFFSFFSQDFYALAPSIPLKADVLCIHVCIYVVCVRACMQFVYPLALPPLPPVHTQPQTKQTA